jgi:glyoxylase-like metal-dependent hydrolase (beta-lactamase superfamily II)
MIIASMHSWLIRTPDHIILLDTCVGNDKERDGAKLFHQKSFPYLAALAAAGVRPEEVDFVLCTHLHVDHVGWNTRLVDGRWTPTFPNARYVFSKAENERWRPAPSSPAYADSVLPVIEAGLVDLVDGDHAIGDQLLIQPAPGHTPGHISLRLLDGGERGLFTGDSMHSAIQGAFPDWNSAFCEQLDQAIATRRRLLEYCCETGATLLPQHFGWPFVAKVKPAGDSFRFDFMAT